MPDILRSHRQTIYSAARKLAELLSNSVNNYLRIIFKNYDTRRKVLFKVVRLKFTKNNLNKSYSTVHQRKDYNKRKDKKNKRI